MSNLVIDTQRFPKTEPRFAQAVDKLFTQADPSMTADPAAREHIELCQRYQAMLQSFALRAMRNGIPADQPLNEYVHSREFMMGLNALHMSANLGAPISEDREVQVRALVAKFAMAHPDGISNPEVFAQLQKEIRNTHFLKSLGDRRSRFGEVIEVANTAIKELEVHIKDSSIDPASKARLEEICQSLAKDSSRFLTPGSEMLEAGAALPQMLRDLQKKYGASAAPGAAETAKLIAKLLPKIEELLAARGVPGDSLLPQCAQVLQHLEAIGMISGRVQDPTLMAERAKLEGEAVKLTQMFELQADTETYLRQSGEQLKQKFKDLSTMVAGLPYRPDTLKGTMIRFSEYVDARLKAVENTQDPNKAVEAKKIEAELEYAKLSHTYLQLCRGPELSNGEVDTSRVQFVLDNTASMLKATGSPAYAMLAKKFEEFRRPLGNEDREALEDQGMTVRDRDYSYSLLLDRWRGKTPERQVAVERVISAYSLLERVVQADNKLEAEVAAIFLRKQKGEINDAQFETFAGEAFKRQFGDIERARDELLVRVEATVNRAAKLGHDGIAPLSAEGKEAFAVLLEQQRRAEKPQFDTYSSQKGKLWADGFVMMPVSYLMGNPSGIENLSALSDAELAQRAAKSDAGRADALKLYQALETEIVGTKSDWAPQTGYQAQLRILDTFGHGALAALTPGLAGAVSEQQVNGEKVIRRSEHWDTLVGKELISIRNQLGLSVSDSFGKLHEVFLRYSELNEKHPQAKLLDDRCARYLSMFSRLFNPANERPDSPSLIGEVSK